MMYGGITITSDWRKYYYHVKIRTVLSLVYIYRLILSKANNSYYSSDDQSNRSI